MEKRERHLGATSYGLEVNLNSIEITRWFLKSRKGGFFILLKSLESTDAGIKFWFFLLIVTYSLTGFFSIFWNSSFFLFFNALAAGTLILYVIRIQSDFIDQKINAVDLCEFYKKYGSSMNLKMRLAYFFEKTGKSSLKAAVDEASLILAYRDLSKRFWDKPLIHLLMQIIITFFLFVTTYCFTLNTRQLKTGSELTFFEAICVNVDAPNFESVFYTTLIISMGILLLIFLLLIIRHMGLSILGKKDKDLEMLLNFFELIKK